MSSESRGRLYQGKKTYPSKSTDPESKNNKLTIGLKQKEKEDYRKLKGLVAEAKGQEGMTNRQLLLELMRAYTEDKGIFLMEDYKKNTEGEIE